jgi:hypothetical protein
MLLNLQSGKSRPALGVRRQAQRDAALDFFSLNYEGDPKRRRAALAAALQGVELDLRNRMMALGVGFRRT